MLAKSPGNRLMEKHERGLKKRREILGHDHVDKAEKAKTPFDKHFQDLITEAAWGTVWSSNGITDRERSMLTLALLAATGNFDEIPMHIRATKNTGATQVDVLEVFQHVAIYAGVPKANHAIKIAKKIYAEMNNSSERKPL